MSYFLSPALVRLRDQINAKWQGRDKASDGWIGDTSHQARPSDHNPDWSDGGIVRAIDIDEDLIIGMTAVGEAQPLADALLLDRRTRYVIYEGRIAYGQHVTGVTHGWRPYTGANAHRHHIHISVRNVGGHDRDTRAWTLPGAAPAKPTPPKKEDGFMPDLNDKEQHELLSKTRELHAFLYGRQVDVPWNDGDGKPQKLTVRTALGWLVGAVLEVKKAVADLQKKVAELQRKVK